MHRKLTRSAVAIVAAVSVLLSVLLGGHRFFTCLMTGQVSLDLCCTPTAAAGLEAPPADRSGDAPRALSSGGCCAASRFASPAPGTTPPPPVHAIVAPVVALVPAGVAGEARPGLDSPRSAAWPRAGPPHRRPREQQRRLMVSLT